MRPEARMKVSIAAGSGSCFGVRRAIRLAERALAESRGPLYTLGELIHNPQVVKELERKGLRVALRISDIKKGTLVIRCHGVAPGIVAEAKKRGVGVIDATCPFVKKAQDLALLLSNAGYSVVIVGDRGHPEVEAIADGLPSVFVVADEKEAESLEKAGKLGVIAQTTQSFRTFCGVVSILLGKAQELRVFNTICETTFSRQREALKLAGEVNVLIVVGGKNSANTARLYDVCRNRVKRTHWVEDVSELKAAWFKDAVHAGVTGGASTPEWLIREVADRMASFEVSKSSRRRGVSKGKGCPKKPKEKAKKGESV